MDVETEESLRILFAHAAKRMGFTSEEQARLCGGKSFDDPLLFHDAVNRETARVVTFTMGEFHDYADTTLEQMRQFIHTERFVLGEEFDRATSTIGEAFLSRDVNLIAGVNRWISQRYADWIEEKYPNQWSRKNFH